MDEQLHECKIEALGSELAKHVAFAIHYDTDDVSLPWVVEISEDICYVRATLEEAMQCAIDGLEVLRSIDDVLKTADGDL